MTVETITGTSDETALNIAWPQDQDFFREGAAHIRALKQILKNLFEDGVALEALNAGTLNGQDPSYYLDFDNMANIPSEADAPSNQTITITAGDALSGGGSFTLNQPDVSSITINHSDTSSQASVNNSGDTVIQDITLDEYGHITGINSTTISIPSDPSTSLNAVGTYAFLTKTNYTGSSPGATLAGSSLRYSSAGGDQVVSPKPSGTWRLMGYIPSSVIPEENTSVWVRIS